MEDANDGRAAAEFLIYLGSAALCFAIMSSTCMHVLCVPVHIPLKFTSTTKVLCD